MRRINNWWVKWEKTVETRKKGWKQQEERERERGTEEEREKRTEILRKKWKQKQKFLVKVLYKIYSKSDKTVQNVFVYE